MIYKTILFLSILWIGTFSLAQEKVLSSDIQRARQFRSELVQKQDEMLELLLQVPFEQRQYIFPLLSAKQSIPKKIKTHPEILVWKGKKPTRIADRFKNDQELIEYLPEQFYYFLSPDMWSPQITPGPMEENPNQILKNLIAQEKADNLSVMPEELLDVYNGLNILQKWIQKIAQQPQMPLYFEKWGKTLPTDIQKQIKEKTKLSSLEFGKKVDAVAQSYRLYENKKIPPSSKEQQLVQEYWSLIPFIFQKTGFRDVLNSNLYPD